MSEHLRSRWLYPVILFVLAIGIFGAIGLFKGGPGLSEAQGAVMSAQATAGYQTTDKLLINVTLANSDDDKQLKGTLAAELLDADGKVVARTQRTISQSESSAGHSLEFKAPKQAPEKLKLRCQFGKEQFEVPLAQILLVKAHETTLTVGKEFHANSTAALRCQVQGVKSLSESVALPGSAVSVKLHSRDGKKSYDLYSGKPGADGVASVQMKLPKLPPGQYKLEVITKSNLGQDKLE